MNFKPNLTPTEVTKKEVLEDLVSEISILVLPINGIRAHGKNLMC